MKHNRSTGGIRYLYKPSPNIITFELYVTPSYSVETYFTSFWVGLESPNNCIKYIGRNGSVLFWCK